MVILFLYMLETSKNTTTVGVLLMPAVRVVDRISDQADFNGPLVDGQFIKYDATSQKFILANAIATSFVYRQDVPSAVWLITHGLNKRPNVVVVDSAESIVVGDIAYVDGDGNPSSNALKITFSAGFAGKAYIS